VTGLFGGAFDPPHNGHVALARKGASHFGLHPLVVLVNAAPGHKQVATPPEARLELARAAFPEYEVELDPHARTIELLESGRWGDPLFLVGADEFARFFEIWHRPEDVVELARLGVATRPGFERAVLEDVLSRLARPDRVEFFEIEPLPVSSHEIRDLVARGEPIDDLVPPAVASRIAELGLYRGQDYTKSIDQRN
jgi:nicotinate-nucleotide adenylyltransferase